MVEINERLVWECKNKRVGRIEKPFDGPLGFPPLFPELSKQYLRRAMQYISHSDPTEMMARIERVRQGIEAESSMRLTRISGDLDKGKGHVFSYKEPSFTQLLQCQSEKAMALSGKMHATHEEEPDSSSLHASALSTPVLISTGFQLGPLSEGRVSGNLSQRKVVRKRPTAWKRKMNTTDRAVAEEQVGFEEVVVQGWGDSGDPMSIMDRISQTLTRPTGRL
ncbi:hypothetical protein HID58_085692 [Brassica napus]|uniref:Uncharacterized protein n=1 Tax=Brassica napus TaxID=3708 RepID=A0ABQ7XNA6_BRANA|nr:hypothetical protein HID58_085692 [Brassica napus]